MLNDEHITPEPAAEEAFQRVVYIMGVVRSGSTVLDTILGNHPDVQSGGELCYLPRHGWINDQFCSCGRRGNACEFWSEVRREWVRRTGGDLVEAYDALINKMEARRWWLPSFGSPYRRSSSLFQEYAEATRALLASIRAVSGKPVIVDASKRCTRALALSLIPQIDLRIVHLVRDARGMAWSMKKRLLANEKAGIPQSHIPLSVWHSAVGWTARNLQSAWVRRRLPAARSIRIRYEDLVADPAAALAKIGRLIDVDLSSPADALVAGQAIGVEHALTGNRLRMARSVQLRPDLEWTTKMPSRDRSVCWLLSGWLLRRYGYARSPGGEPSSRADLPREVVV